MDCLNNEIALLIKNCFSFKITSVQSQYFIKHLFYFVSQIRRLPSHKHLVTQVKFASHLGDQQQSRIVAHPRTIPHCSTLGAMSPLRNAVMQMDHTKTLQGAHFNPIWPPLIKKPQIYTVLSICLYVSRVGGCGKRVLSALTFDLPSGCDEMKILRWL